MNLMAIDIIGTINELIKRALKEFLLLLGTILLGLSAPLLYTVAAELAIWSDPHSVESWGTTYYLLGPFACAIWMVFICHLHSVHQWNKRGKLNSWRRDHGGIFRTAGKSTLFMIGGFFGSAVSEAIFLTGSYYVFPHSPSQTDFMVAYAIAPLFVFAPVLLVLLSRWIRRDEYATAI